MENPIMMFTMIAFAIVFLFLWFLYRLKHKEWQRICMELQHAKSQWEQKFLKEHQLSEELRAEIRRNREELIQVQSELRHTFDRLQEERNNEEKQIVQFEHIAHKILSNQSVLLQQQSEKGMKDILLPLQERIRLFEHKVDLTNKESIARHSSLKEQIHHLSQQSDKVAKDANNLARALKGDYKKQGNWGELILESILEKSGLEKDREYFVQITERNYQGKMQKPDVVICLPDQKKLIIDSKVSLSAYEELLSHDTEEESQQLLKAHSFAVKRHVDELSSKNYHDLYEMDSPDFVLMFVPIDTAFGLALKEDGQLYNYAFDRNIVIVTPSTLLATLKTVETMWRNEKQNRYALEIAQEAGRMYDKFVGFVVDLERMGVQLNTVLKTYDASMNKLVKGAGNVVGKAERIRNLGAKANKYLPSNILKKMDAAIES